MSLAVSDIVVILDLHQSGSRSRSVVEDPTGDATNPCRISPRGIRKHGRRDPDNRFIRREINRAMESKMELKSETELNTQAWK